LFATFFGGDTYQLLALDQGGNQRWMSSGRQKFRTDEECKDIICKKAKETRNVIFFSK